MFVLFMFLFVAVGREADCELRQDRRGGGRGGEESRVWSTHRHLRQEGRRCCLFRGIQLECMVGSLHFFCTYSVLVAGYIVNVTCQVNVECHQFLLSVSHVSCLSDAMFCVILDVLCLTVLPCVILGFPVSRCASWCHLMLPSML